MKNRIYPLSLLVLATFAIWASAQHWNILMPSFKLDAQKDRMKKMSLAQTIEGRFEQEFLMTRDPATNTIPRERLLTAYRIAQEKRALMALAERAIPIYWQERGPNNVGGRTRGLIFDANDPTGHTVWAAGVAGGLWRTTNIQVAAPTWILVDDFFANLAIMTIAQDPSNANRMYFGTGEENLNFGDPVRGLGIWRSMDGGVNWARLPGAFANVYKIVIANDGTVYAGTDAGLQISTDGINFLPVAQVTGFVPDVEIAANGDVFATQLGGNIFRLQAGTWIALNSPNFPAGFRRIEIACAPSNALTLYASFGKAAAPNQGICQGVFLSTDGGGTWQTQTVPPAYGGQAWYNFAMSVDPNNASRLFLGGQGLSVSGDMGSTWTQVMGVHADHHTVTFRQGNSNEIVFSNDGGVYYCTNGTNANPTLAARNNLYNVTQFYTNAIHPNSGSNYMLGGTQDNGTPQFNAAGISSTIEAPGTGGDGAYCFIDQDNPMIQVAASQNRRFYASNNGGSSFNTVISSKAATLFITPAEYDDANDILYLSDNVDTLGRLSGVGAANTFVLERVAAFGGQQASAIAVSPNTPNRLFVGTTGGRVVRIDNAHLGTFTANVLSSPRNANISCILVEPGNDNHLIATFSNYGAAGQVFESTDGGTMWTNLTNDLPDMPVRWAMFHPFDEDKVLLATELGVWSTDDLDGVNTEWWPSNNFGLANVRVDMLQYRPSDHLVAAATHGRGMFTTDYFTLLNTCLPSLNISGAVMPGIYMAEDFIVSDGVIAPSKKVIYHAGNRIQLTPGFHAQRGSDFWALIEACGIGPTPNDAQDPSNLMNRTHDQKIISSTSLALLCSPNPVTYQLRVEFDLPTDGVYSLYVRDIQGKLVESLASQENRAAGHYQVELNAINYHAGIYVISLQSSTGAISKQFVVSR